MTPVNFQCKNPVYRYALWNNEIGHDRKYHNFETIATRKRPHNQRDRKNLGFCIGNVVEGDALFGPGHGFDLSALVVAAASLFAVGVCHCLDVVSPISCRTFHAVPITMISWEFTRISYNVNSVKITMSIRTGTNTNARINRIIISIVPLRSIESLDRDT
jgi:hypothetical protein